MEDHTMILILLIKTINKNIYIKYKNNNKL